MKFMLVGLSGMIIKLVLLFTIVELTGLHYLLVYPMVFFVSVGNNYIWNSLWTFKGSSNGIRGYFKYCGVSLVTLGFNEALLFILSTLLGLWYIYAAMIGTGVAFIFNFTLSRRLVWKE